MNLGNITGKWLAEHAASFEKNAISWEVHSGGASPATTIDFDFDKGVGQVCLWPSGTGEATVGTLEAPPATRVFQFENEVELVAELDRLAADILRSATTR